MIWYSRINKGHPKISDPNPWNYKCDKPRRSLHIWLSQGSWTRKVIWVDPKCKQNPWGRQRLDREGETALWTQIRVMWPQAKECQQPSEVEEERKKKNEKTAGSGLLWGHVVLSSPMTLVFSAPPRAEGRQIRRALRLLGTCKYPLNHMAQFGWPKWSICSCRLGLTVC